MPTIDSTTPAGVQPDGFSSGFTLTMSDEFNSSTLDSKWSVWKDFSRRSPGSNWDINDAGNSCFRCWPASSPTYYDNEVEVASLGSNPFRQRYGFFEVSVQCPRGKGMFLSPLWLFHEGGDGNEPEIDVVEHFAYENGDWLVDTTNYRLKNAVGTVWAEGGGGTTNQTGAVYIRDAGGPGYDNTISTTFHTYGCWWTPQSLRFYYDGQLYGEIADPWPNDSTTQLFVLFSQLWWGTRAGVPAPNTTDTPTGTSNPYLTDYVRVWVESGGSTPPPSFNASLVTAPAAEATLTGNVYFEITGNQIQNAELLPATGYTPMYGRFTLAGGTSGTLNFDSTTLSNGSYVMRIAAFNAPPGAASASEIVCMTRTYTVSNSNSFLASLVQAPAEGASLSGTVAFAIEGNRIQRARLLPEVGDTTDYGDFIVNAAGTRADLAFNSTVWANGAYRMRIDAYDTSAGSTAIANVITAMQPRNYVLANGSPPSFTATLVTAPAAGASLSGIAVFVVSGAAMQNVELRALSAATATIYSRTVEAALRTFDMDGGTPFGSWTAGGVIHDWLYNGIDSTPVSSGGVTPWIIKTSVSGASVTRFQVLPTDAQLYDWRSQFTVAPFEMYKRYRITVEFMLDSDWDLTEVNGDGLMTQAMHAHKTGQNGNSSWGLDIDQQGRLYFAILYPASAYSVSSWPATVTWSAGGYVQPTVVTSYIAVTKSVWHTVEIELFADDRPPAFGGEGYVTLTYDGAPWVTNYQRPNIQPDRSSGFGGTDPHFDFGWYNWGRQPATTRTLFMKQMNVQMVPDAAGTPALYGRFAISTNGANAVLSLTCAELAVGTYEMQVLAYNQPPGATSATEAIPMSARTYYVAESTPVPLPDPGATQPDREFIVCDMDGFLGSRVMRRWR